MDYPAKAACAKASVISVASCCPVETDCLFVSDETSIFSLAQTFFLSGWSRLVYHNCLRYMAAELPNCR